MEGAVMKNNIRTINDYIVRENRKKFKTERISFLSHISHGIRTPLNSIMGFSKLLGLRNTIDPKQKEYIQGILNGSQLLLQFVENVMDLSQFEANNYSLRVEKHDLNQILWEFTEDFYNQRIENKDTSINLMLVWDKEVNNLSIETDSFLLKKALQRMINLVTVKYPIVEFELGYHKMNDKVSIFIRPTREKLTEEQLLSQHEFYSVDENDSFDYFNYRVLTNSVSVLGGDITTDSVNQEFSFEIPVIYERKSNLNII
ncbi:MAG: hypothetical protein C0597_12410 [Marinilabiliales bacterium]|nr:MAG: hypothetical protein C0597_12410 [Marinilabiliales bacterium]